MRNDIPFANDYLELTIDEVPKSDINDILEDMWNDESVRQLIYEDNGFAYDDVMYAVDTERNPSPVTIEIPWESSSQGPYVRGNVKVSFDNYPSTSVKIDMDDVDGIVDAEITDIYCNGYEISEDDINVGINYDGDADYDDVYDAVAETNEFKQMIKECVDNVNKYLDMKWDVIKKYDLLELQPFDEEFLRFECDANGLVFLYEYDEEGNPTKYVGFEFN